MRNIDQVDKGVYCLNCSLKKGKPDRKKSMINPKIYLKNQGLRTNRKGYIRDYILLECPDCGRLKMNPLFNKTDVWTLIREKNNNKMFKKNLKRCDCREFIR